MVCDHPITYKIHGAIVQISVALAFANLLQPLQHHSTSFKASIADADSAGPASATSVWADNPTFVFVTKADPEVLKEGTFGTVTLFDPGSIYLLEEQIAMLATGKLK